jgi:Ni/Fe-hydrogenase subunit HybB-like protein
MLDEYFDHQYETFSCCSFKAFNFLFFLFWHWPNLLDVNSVSHYAVLCLCVCTHLCCAYTCAALTHSSTSATRHTTCGGRSAMAACTLVLCVCVCACICVCHEKLICSWNIVCTVKSRRLLTMCLLLPLSNNLKFD